MLKSLSALFSLAALLLGVSAVTQAQSLSTGSLTPSIVCPPATLTVPFSVTGPFAAGNVFTAQLSNASGSFSGTPTTIGSLTASPTSATTLTITGNIPSGTTASSLYQVRIITSASFSSISPTLLTVGTAAPTAPATTPIFCQNASSATVSATGQNLQWYANAASTTAAGSGATFSVSTATIGSASVYVTQTLNGCESAKTQVAYTVSAPPSAPGVTSISVCQGQSVSPLTASFASGATPNWYGTNASGGTASATAPTPSNTSTATYYVSQSVGGCESSRAAVTVVVVAAPAAPSVAIPPAYCPGDAAAPLSATGQSLQWYGTSATGGTPTASQTPSTATSGTLNYYVSQTVSGCESPRAVVSVTVKTKPAAPGVTNTPVQYCVGQTPVPIDATPNSGGSINWYGTNATGGTASSASPVPSTSAPGTVVYYVSQTVNGCESPRTSVTVVVTAIPSAPSPITPADYCQGATASPLTATGQNLQWYVGPTGGSATASLTPSTSTVGNTTYYVSQIVSSCESSRASVTVRVKALPDAPTVSAVSFCQNTTPPTLAATAVSGATLNWYATLTSSASTTPPTPTNGTVGTQTFYVSQTLNGCEGPKASLSVMVKTTPATPGVTPISYCVGQTASALTATPVNNASLNWYGNSPTGGTVSATAPLPPTSTVGVTNFYVSQTLNGCEGARAALPVTINAIPAAPTVSPAGPYCQGAPVGLLSANGQNLRWYGQNSTGGTATNTQTPDNITVGTFNYYVSQTVNNCESPRGSVAVQIKPLPAQPTTTPIEFCQNTTPPTLAATAVSGATLNWYATLTSSASTTPPTPTNGTVGTQTFYVSQTLNGCEGPKASLSVLVKTTPATPGVTPISYCFGQTASALTATPVNNASLNWYGNSPTGGTASATAPLPPTSTVGVANFYVSQTLNGCEGARAALAVTINAIPAAPTVSPAGPYCQGAPVGLLSANGQNLRWYGQNSTGGTATNTQTPDNITVGTFNYYVSQTVNNCESPRGAVTVQIKTTPGLPGTAPLDFCQNTPPPTLSASSVNGASLNWYGITTSGPSTNTPPVVPNGNATTFIYYVSQTLDGCEGPKATLAVRIKPTPAPPSTTPVAYCNNAPAQSLIATGQSLTWYDPNDNVIGSNAPTPNTGSVGTQAFKVTQTVEGCISNKATLAVTINAIPGAPTTANLLYCVPTQDQPLQNVGSLTAVGQNLKWYNPDGNVYSQVPTPPISQTTTIAYQVTQTVNNCESPKATVQVSVQTTPAPVIPIPLVTYCRNDVAKPLEAVGTNLRWIDPNNNLLPPNTTPTPPTLNATPAGGVFYQVYQTGSNGCVSPRSAIKVVINTNPTLSLLGTAQINLGQSTPLKLQFTGASPFSYTLSNGISSTAVGDTSIVVVPRQTTTYQVVNVANVCGSGLPGSTATVTVNVPTITTGNLNVSTLCAGLAFTVPFSTQGNFNLDLGYQVQLVAVADTAARNPITLNTTGFQTNPITVTIPNNTPGGNYAVRLVRTVSSTPLIQVLGTYSPVRLTVQPKPTAILSGTQNLYEGGIANLTITFGGDAPWTFVYADSSRTFAGTATVSPYQIPVQPLKTTTYRLTSVSNVCNAGTVSGTATVTVLPILGVELDPLSSVVKAYPIPTTSRLTIIIDRPLYTESAQLELVDMRGNVVEHQTTRSRQTDLDLSTQPAGLYILKVTIGDKQTSRKILKQ